MFCPRALVIIIAATAFSATAFAQTRGSALIRGPIASAVLSRAAPNPPPCHSTICTSVQRYAKTLIVSATEFFFFSDGTCTFADPGKWTAPTDIMPVVNGNPAGTVTVNAPAIPGPAPINPDTGAPCTGGGTYMYAPLYFTWTLHQNSTAVPGFGPTATFSSTWNGDFGSFFAETFEISVPVVRPKGEIGSVLNWEDSRANWEQTLIPPDDDPSFSFTGEQVKEVLLSSNPVTGDKSSNSCAARAPNALDGTPNGQAAQTPWRVDQDNKWGNDTVGFGPCAVEAYRCAGANSVPFPCGYVVPQQMYIKSPADSGFTYVYSNNVLGGGVDVSVPIGPLFKQFFGIVSSQRATGLFGGQVRDLRGFPSSKNDCLAYINLNKC